MLGTDMAAELLSRGMEVRAVGHAELDVTNPEDVARLASGEFGKTEWIVNCAAYTAVDKAESEIREATGLNSIAPGYLATAASQLGAKIIHISTDFVFDGTATSPYKEDAATNPLGVYGRTKLEGEQAVLRNNANSLIVRTAWLYGANGNSFPRTMIRAHLAGKALRVVADQVGCPTYTKDVAKFVANLIGDNAFPGIYHCVGPEAMSWHEFATRAINAYERSRGNDTSVSIEPISAADWPTPATRPAYSVLGDTKTSFHARPVDEALADFLTSAEL